MEVQQSRIADSLEALVVPIDSLAPDPSNARRHSERNIDTIRGSLARFGQTKPIVLAENGQSIIAGNGTWYAAKALGWTHIAAATSSLKEAEAVAYGIADNRTAELAEWDEDTLAELLDALPEDLQEVAGYDPEELAELLKIPTGDPHEDEVPPVPKDPITKRGDLWLFDAHWVCDDCGKRYEYQEGVDMKECPCG